MKIPYRGLEIESEIENITEVLSFELKSELNDHVYARLKCLVEEENYAGLIAEHMSADSSVSVYDENKILFSGYLLNTRAQVEKGKWTVEMEYVSGTHDLDIRKRERVFYRQDDSYRNVIDRIHNLYPQVQIKDEIAGEQKTPGVLLQYEETDWEFLKRLASNFSTYLVPDTSDVAGRFYFGMPDINNNTEIRNIDYEIVQDENRYYHHTDIMKQEHICWRIVSRKNLLLGEEVVFNHVVSIVIAVHIYERNGSLVREYTLHRKDGIFTEMSANYEILGLSLPATVVNRRGNQVQVEFDINESYESEQPSKYFVYGIESSSFYCMPEIGSRVHIYFPGRKEGDAIAVHALNMEDAVGRKPSDKTFSSPSGAAMQLTPTHYEFQSDSSGASVLTLGSDGNIALTGTNILLDASKSIRIGEGKEEPTPEIIFEAKTEQSVKIAKDASSISLNSDNVIYSDKVALKAESGDMSAAAAEIIKSLEEFDAQLMEEYNRKQKEKFENGDKEIKQDQAGKRDSEEDPWDFALANFDLYDPEKPFISDRDREVSRPKYYNKDEGMTNDEADKAIKDAQPDVVKNLSATWTGEAVYQKGEVSEDYKHVGGEIEVGKAYATASAYGGLFDVDKDGKCVFKPGIGASVGAGAVLMDSEVEFSLLPNDQEYFNVKVGGGVSCLEAAASAEIGLGRNAEGKVTVGASAEAGVYLVEGEAEAGVTLLGIDANVKASGKVGLGAEANFGYKDGKIKAKLGVVVLVGGSVEFEIDIGDCVDMVSGWFE